MTDKPTSIDPAAMTCREIESFIDDYMEKNLPDDQRDTFDAHIDYCPDCFNFMINYRNAVKLGKNAYADESVTSCEAIPENLVQAILKANKK